MCAVITPWNFPFAVPLWMLGPSLVEGNTVVFKPSEDTPAIGQRLVELFEEAGFPPGVVNLVHGEAECGEALVRNPGVKLAPAGTTARELIEEFCGGMAEGHRFAFYLPGGASGGILPASMADIPLDFGKLEQHGCFVGSHAVVILSDRDDPRAAALNLLRFFKDESCGQCTPCRVGCDKAVALLERKNWDGPLLNELAQAMRDASICGLGQAAPNAFITAMEFFSREPARTDVAGQPDRY